MEYTHPLSCAAWHRISNQTPHGKQKPPRLWRIDNGRAQYNLCPQRARSGSPTNNRETDRFSHEKGRGDRGLVVRLLYWCGGWFVP